MANYISEHQIEVECVKVLMDELKYDEYLNLWQLPDDGNKPFGRTEAQQVVRLPQLQASLKKLNPSASPTVLQDALSELTASRAHLSPFEANRAVTKLLREGFDVPTRNAKGERVTERVRFVNYANPANNHFAVVQQLTIKGKSTRRPDLLIYINGLPMVFVELKNAIEATRQAYDKNLIDYRRDIPQLFEYNLVVVLSNTFETKVGSMTSDWEQFYNWEKVASESEEPVPEAEVDLLRVMRGLFRKEVLIDLLENFILFYANRAKIISKNHQYLGVNSALASFGQREKLGGKLGVFWHTQGSGKSFSMAYFAQKIRRKHQGNFKFVLITDREDLEDQLHKTFVRAGLIEEKQPARARSATHLGQLLQDSSGYVFTLIQKFKSPGKGTNFPSLTDRDDLVVIVDEAHRSQYKELGKICAKPCQERITSLLRALHCLMR